MSNNNKIVMSEQELRQSLYRIYYNDFKNSTQKITCLQSNTQNISSPKHTQFEKHLKEYFSLSFKMKKSQAQVLNEVNKFTKRILREQEGDTVETVEDSDDPINTSTNSDQIDAKLLGRKGLLPYNIDASVFDLMGNLSEFKILDQNNIQGALDLASLLVLLAATEVAVVVGVLIAGVNIVNRLVAINTDNEEFELMSWDSVALLCDSFAFLPWLKLIKRIRGIKPLFNALSKSGNSVGKLLKQAINAFGGNVATDVFDDIMKLLDFDFANLTEKSLKKLEAILEKLNNTLNLDDTLRNSLQKIINLFPPNNSENVAHPITQKAIDIIQSINRLLMHIREGFKELTKLKDQLRALEGAPNKTERITQQIVELEKQIDNLDPILKTKSQFKNGSLNLIEMIEEIANGLSDFFSITIKSNDIIKPISKFEAFKDSFAIAFSNIPVLQRLTSPETKALSQFINGMADDLARYANLRISKSISDQIDKAAQNVDDLYNSNEYKEFINRLNSKGTKTADDTNFLNANKFVPSAGDLGNIFFRGGLDALDDVAQNIIRQSLFILNEASLVLQGIAKNSDEVVEIIVKNEKNLNQLAKDTDKIKTLSDDAAEMWAKFRANENFAVIEKTLNSLVITIVRPQWKLFKEKGIANIIDQVKEVLINKAQYLINLQKYLTNQMDQMQKQIDALARMSEVDDAFKVMYQDTFDQIKALREQISELTDEFKRFNGLFDTSILDDANDLTKMMDATARFAKVTDDRYIGLTSRITAALDKLFTFSKDFDELFKKVNISKVDDTEKTGFMGWIRAAGRGVKDFFVKISGINSFLTTCLFIINLLGSGVVTFLLGGGVACFTVSAIVSWLLTHIVPNLIRNVITNKIIRDSAAKSIGFLQSLKLYFGSINKTKTTVISFTKYIVFFEKSSETLAGLLQKIGGLSSSAAETVDKFMIDKSDEIVINDDDYDAVTLNIPGLSPQIPAGPRTSNVQYSYQQSDVKAKMASPFEEQPKKEEKAAASQQPTQQDDDDIVTSLVDQAYQNSNSEVKKQKVVSPNIASFAVNKKAKNDEINYANSLFVLAYRKAKTDNFVFELNDTTLRNIKADANSSYTEKKITLPKSIFYDSDFAVPTDNEQKKTALAKLKQAAGNSFEKITKYLFVQTQIDDGSFFNSLSNEAQVIISNYYKDLETIILQTINEFCKENKLSETKIKEVLKEVLLNNENKNFKEVRRLKRHKDLIFKKYQDLLDVFVPGYMGDKREKLTLRPNQLQETFNQLNIYKNWNSLCDEDVDDSEEKKVNYERRLNFNDNNKIKFLLPDDDAAKTQFNTWVQENQLLTKKIITFPTDNNNLLVTVNDPATFLGKLTVTFDDGQRIMAPIVTEEGVIPGADVYDEINGQKIFSDQKYQKLQNTLKLKGSLLSAVINGSFGISKMGENSYADEFDKLNQELPAKKFKKDAAAAYATSAAPIQTLFNGAVAVSATSYRIFSNIFFEVLEQSEQTGQTGKYENAPQKVNKVEAEIEAEKQGFIEGLIKILQQ